MAQVKTLTANGNANFGGLNGRYSVYVVGITSGTLKFQARMGNNEAFVDIPDMSYTAPVFTNLEIYGELNVNLVSASSPINIKVYVAEIKQ